MVYIYYRGVIFMILIIAEKPSVMKNIIDAHLENVKPRAAKGCQYGKDFIYTHCIGHLLTLKMPGDINDIYKKWDINTLPFRFDDIPLEVNKSVSEQYHIVESLINRDDIEEVVNACDSDREGDLIFRNLLNNFIFFDILLAVFALIGRKPYIPLHAMIIEIMLDLGFLMRGEIIWDKSASGGGSCAWGSWMSASNPVLRDYHEYILVFSKDSYSKNREQVKKDTITHDDFIEWTRSVWTFPAVNAKKIGHPAPFPVELPHRLINLYSYEGDVVLDPFCGSGTTAIAAMQNNRKYICYDIKQEYIDLAKRRISNQKFI